MPMQRLFPSRRRVTDDDPLEINSRSWHQYYATVQSDVYPYMLLDQALERRQTRALHARRQRWLRRVLMVSLVLGVAVWFVA